MSEKSNEVVTPKAKLIEVRLKDRFDEKLRPLIVNGKTIEPGTTIRVREDQAKRLGNRGYLAT